MKISPSPRRYLVPAACMAAVVVSYAFGYITNILLSDTPSQIAAAQAAVATSQKSGSTAGTDPAAVAAANRIGRQFTDDGLAIGGLTVGQVTGGQPLDDWLKKLMAQDDEAFRLRNFMLLYDALNNPEDIKSALKALQGLNGGRSGRMEASLLLQKLTVLDPKEALALAAEGRGGERLMSTSLVVRTWAKSDPAAALAWVKANGAPKEGEERRGGPGGSRGPGDAGGSENWLLTGVITQIAKTDLEKALTEASTVKGRMSGRTADALVGEIIQQRGADAARNAAAALPEGDFKNDFIQQLTGKLAAQDPKGAASWASSLPAGETKSRALREAVQQWIRKDAPAASAFVSTLPVAAESDSARSRVAVEVASKDQKAALAMIGGITDPERQKRTVGEIAGSIARRDPAASQQFVAQTSIDDRAKAEIARSVSRPQRGSGGTNAPGGRGGRGGPGGPGGSRTSPGGQPSSR